MVQIVSRTSAISSSSAPAASARGWCSIPGRLPVRL